jgi:transcriptional regulator with XRE-family HTH domain
MHDGYRDSTPILTNPLRGGRPTGRARSNGPHPVDVHVGSRVRLRRTMIGMSQEKLGDAIGLTFQQVQKYERGTNRMGASRLYQVSCVLEVPVEFFFEGFSLNDLADADRAMSLSEGPASPYEAPELKRESIELVRIYQRIGDSAVRRRLFDLARAVADAYFRG